MSITSERREMISSCSLCGYMPPAADDDDDDAERIGPSDMIAGRPLTCNACEEVTEAEIVLARAKQRRDQRCR